MVAQKVEQMEKMMAVQWAESLAPLWVERTVASMAVMRAALKVYY
jgi:hypothetical protein